MTAIDSQPRSSSPAGAEPTLNVTDLVVRYGGRKAAHLPAAVDGVSFALLPGETLGLVGESGSGKSTIGKAVLGLQRPTAGRITFDGRDVTQMAPPARRDIAAQLRAVFQDPYSSLDPRMSVGQILAEPLRVRKVGKLEAAAQARAGLAAVGLPEDAADRYPRQFSGGQRQRIAIARALITRPKVVVCDEPVSALDLSTQAQVLNLLAELRDRERLAYLFVAHDLAVVEFLAQRILVLYRGQIMELGDADAVVRRPRHPYTIALTAAAPVPDPVEQARRRALRASAGIGAAGMVEAATAGCPFASRCPSATAVCTDERPELRSVDGRLVACHHA